MTTPWERFKQAARLEEPDPVPIALTVDSPWLPGYTGINTLDYYLKPDLWFVDFCSITQVLLYSITPALAGAL